MSQCQCHNNQTPQGQGACSSQQGDFVLSQAERDAIEHEKHHYEDPRAASIEALKRAGVVFEDYDYPGLKTVNHVCVLGAEKAAWFKDTEGNYLCIHQDLPQA